MAITNYYYYARRVTFEKDDMLPFLLGCLNILWLWQDNPALAPREEGLASVP
jgi:hypothetical protein